MPTSNAWCFRYDVQPLRVDLVKCQEKGNCTVHHRHIVPHSIYFDPLNFQGELLKISERRCKVLIQNACRELFLEPPLIWREDFGFMYVNVLDEVRGVHVAFDEILELQHTVEGQVVSLEKCCAGLAVEEFANSGDVLCINISFVVLVVDRFVAGNGEIKDLGPNLMWKVAKGGFIESYLADEGS